MRLNNPNCPNFLDTKNGRFASLNNAMDNVFIDLCMSGVDSDSKETEVLSKDEEKQRWEGGVLECNSPKALFQAIFFLNGKNFYLRGGDEHRSLKFSQLNRHNEPNRYVYMENASKNRSGVLAQMRVTNEIVPIYMHLLSQGLDAMSIFSIST